MMFRFGIIVANLKIQQKPCHCLKIQLELARMFARGWKIWGGPAAQKLMIVPIPKKRKDTQNADFR